MSPPQKESSFYRGHPLIAVFAHRLDVSKTLMPKLMDARRKRPLSFPFDLRMEIRQKWKALLSWRAMVGKIMPIEVALRRHLVSVLSWEVQPCRGTIHNLQQLYICRARELRRLSLSFFTILKYLLLSLGKNPAEH